MQKTTTLGDGVILKRSENATENGRRDSCFPDTCEGKAAGKTESCAVAGKLDEQRKRLTPDVKVVGHCNNAKWGRAREVKVEARST